MKKCKFEKIHLMSIAIDNDFVIYNRYTLEFLLLESWNSKILKFYSAILPFHAGQLWTKNFQVAIFIKPYTSLQNWKS